MSQSNDGQGKSGLKAGFIGLAASILLTGLLTATGAFPCALFVGVIGIPVSIIVIIVAMAGGTRE